MPTKTLLAATLAACAVLAGCSDDPISQAPTNTPPQTGPVATDLGDAPAAATEPLPTTAPTTATPSDGTVTDTDGRVYRDVKVGQAGRDGNITFIVRSFKAVASVPRDDFLGDGPLTPTAGAKLIAADVEYRNDGKEGVLPFCGGTSAVLIDLQGRNFDPVDEMTLIVGNDELCDEVQPGFKGRVTLAFQIPKAATASTLALWDDSEEGDSFSPQTLVRVSRGS